MRLDYLEQNEPNLCDQMMLEGTLLPSCSKMGLDAQQLVDKTLHDLMQKAQMPDRKGFVKLRRIVSPNETKRKTPIPISEGSKNIHAWNAFFPFRRNVFFLKCSFSMGRANRLRLDFIAIYRLRLGVQICCNSDSLVICNDQCDTADIILQKRCKGVCQNP